MHQSDQPVKVPRHGQEHAQREPGDAEPAKRAHALREGGEVGIGARLTRGRVEVADALPCPREEGLELDGVGLSRPLAGND